MSSFSGSSDSCGGAVKLPPPPTSAQAPPKAGNNSSDSRILPSMCLGPGNYDRAWNDPPMFGTDINTMGKPVPTKLTKRVPYPGLGVSGSPVSSGIAMMPPSMGSGDPNPTMMAGVGTTTTTPDQTTQVELIPTFPSPGAVPSGSSISAAYQPPVTDAKPQEI